jgi:hypothetical protein
MEHCGKDSRVRVYWFSSNRVKLAPSLDVYLKDSADELAELVGLPNRHGDTSLNGGSSKCYAMCLVVSIKKGSDS